MKNIQVLVENYAGRSVEDSVWNSVNSSTRFSVRYFVNNSFGVPVSNFYNGPTNHQVTTDFIEAVDSIIGGLYEDKI